MAVGLRDVSRWKSWVTLARGSRRTPIAHAPGTLVSHAEALPTSVHVTRYTAAAIEEQEEADVEDIPGILAEPGVVWVDVHGLRGVDIIGRLGDAIGAHKLTMEDVVNVPQRPKVDDHGDHIFLTLRALRLGEEGGLAAGQVSLFVGGNYVLTFHEEGGDGLDSVRARLQRAAGRIRGAGSDYLMYALMDAVIDAYFPLLEYYGEQLEEMEAAIVHPSREDGRDTILRLHALRRDLLGMRRRFAPLRDAVATLLRSESPLINEDTRPYIDDMYDHITRASDLADSYSELSGDLMDFYLSMSSHRMNEVMKVLTIIATIFIPLSFVAALFGMNFDSSASPWNMPELRWYWGYPAALLIMAIIGLGLLALFRRKRWL
jgi:magnesium transporter